VLDVACGTGRHVRSLHRQGMVVTGVDIDSQALKAAADATPGAQLLAADLEHGPWPFADRRFDAVVVTNYLWRPLWPALMTCLAPGGLYLHETFSEDQPSVGRPRRSEFLLDHGELLQACAALRIVAYEDGFLSSPDRFVQRIVAVAPGRASDPLPWRASLDAASGAGR
jgi:SAM-dependent methyltransferase